MQWSDGPAVSLTGTPRVCSPMTCSGLSNVCEPIWANAESVASSGCSVLRLRVSSRTGSVIRPAGRSVWAVPSPNVDRVVPDNDIARPDAGRQLQRLRRRTGVLGIKRARCGC